MCVEIKNIMFEEGLALVVYQIPTDLDIHLFESAVSGTLYTVIRKYNELETQMNNIPNSDLTPNEVIEVVCNMMSISPIEMMRKSRKTRVTLMKSASLPRRPPRGTRRTTTANTTNIPAAKIFKNSFLWCFTQITIET